MGLSLPDPDVRALVSGETVVAFVARGVVTEGDEHELEGSGPRRPADLKPAYRRWADAGTPEGDWTAIVVSVDPAASLDVAAGDARHVLAQPGEGDLVVLRVYDGATPVLSDEAFEARRRSVEGAMRG